MKRNEMNEEQKKRNDLLVAAFEKKRDMYNEINWNRGFSDYQFYMAKKDLCESMALILNNAEDVDLAAFYKNAAVGFEERARKLSIGA